MPETLYKTTSTELTSIADAIRSKGGTSAQLQYPDGFISAIGNIPSLSLQSKTCTPSETAQTITPDSGYALSQVAVGAISSNYVGTGVTRKAAQTYTPTTTNQTIASNQYLTGTQTISGDTNLVAGNIKSGVSIFGVNGTYEGSGGSGGGGDELVDFIENGVGSVYENSKVTKIGQGTFGHRTDLKSVNFPACTYIDANAFVNCFSLTTISFPACTSIGDAAFGNCFQLTTVSFPVCTNIGSAAFCYCSSLTTVSLSVCTSIGNNAFAYCSSLTTVSLPVCTSVGSYAFTSCYSLTTVSLPACTSIGNYAFFRCSSLTAVDFPVCTSIGSSAFAYCSSLTTVSFPVCTSIGLWAFVQCYNLLSLYLTGSSVAQLANSSAFNSTPIAGRTTSTGGVYGSIFVPSSLYAAYSTATNWAYFADRFVSIQE